MYCCAMIEVIRVSDRVPANASYFILNKAECYEGAFISLKAVSHE